MRLWAGFCLLAGFLAASSALADPLEISVRPFQQFWLTGGDDADASLQFLGGLDIASPNRDFGGYSGIAVTGDGSEILLIGDSGSFVRARLVHEHGRLVGIAGAEIESLFPEGDGSKKASDAEDVALDPQNSRRGVIVRERQANAMLTFEMDDGQPTNFAPMVVGADNRILRSNKGLESVAYAPAASPAAGKIIAIAERAPRGAENIPGWIAGVGAFEIVPHDDFDVSSARFLPDGDLVLLERRYTPGWGIAMRLRRVDGAALEVGARLDGKYLIDAGMTSQIDNMEGLAVHRDGAGRTILTLVSDDNHSILQRTLILQFALSED